MILDEILAHKRREIDDLQRRYADWSPPAAAAPRREFKQALSTEGISLIAEFKRRSPSRGGIRPGAHPIEVARAYHQAGAVALSVLTDERYFGGSMEDLLAARGAMALPVLRKDFIVDRCQIAESSGVDGPDCLLLIAAALEAGQLRELRELAARCGQAALVEVHDEVELGRALGSGAEIIGINNRDLNTFEVALETTLRLRARVPAGIPVVSESGIRTRDDVLRLADVGVDAMLIGEALMAADDPGAKIHELLGIP
jgi:indole-3-glycerol phosphate synthase